MTELYGPTFSAAYGDSPTPLWTQAISSLTDDECADGLKRLAQTPREFPANLTQFVAACRPRSSGVRYLGVPLTAEQLAALTPPPERRASAEAIRGWIAKLRGYFAGDVSRGSENQKE